MRMRMGSAARSDVYKHLLIAPALAAGVDQPRRHARVDRDGYTYDRDREEAANLLLNGKRNASCGHDIDPTHDLVRAKI
jgi:hypothetical protein